MTPTRRIAHAAHYWNRSDGHDLEELDIISPTRPTFVAGGYEWHSGYVRQGRQHWVYTRRAPLSPGRCPMCPAVQA